jgi:adenylosuccinate lyase
VAIQKEHELRHDVMAHVYAFSEAAPKAKPIIHLGATSYYLCDNTDIILMREALLRIKKLIVTTISFLINFAEKYKDLPTLAFTHYQAAQPTTVGKRACLWLQDLLMDLECLEDVLARLKFLGCKGATGTAASFLELFKGDHEKVKILEEKITAKMGFNECYTVSGQTYTRKVDYYVTSILSGIAQSAHKFSNDIRLLSNLKEFDEPFETNQIGSSAMAYKRNPMRSERIASLARHVIVGTQNTAWTASNQWFERTLDDSANKRITIPEAFLGVDAILSLYINIISDGKVHEKVIEKNLKEELPFMATENILMHCVKKGGDRQTLHETIRKHSVDVATEIKQNGNDNNLLDRIIADPTIGITKEEVAEIVDAKKFVGRAPMQVEEFLQDAREVLEVRTDFLVEGTEIIV